MSVRDLAVMAANAKRPFGSWSPRDVIDPKRALIPSVVRVNERRVKQGFWPKVTRAAAHIPFADRLLSVWYAARDPKTPVAAKGIMLGALAYFVLPVDAIPDVFVGIGFTDDAAVIAALLATLGSHVKPRHQEKAERALEDLKTR